MKKQIKKQSTQNIISFTKEELEIHGWNVGDILDLSDVILYKSKGNDIRLYVDDNYRENLLKSGGKK